MLCPNCNRSVSDGSRFCGSCGHLIEGNSSIPPAGGTSSTMIRPPLAAAPAASAPGIGGSPMGGASSGGGGSSGAASAAAAWGAASARLPGLFERIKNILLTPKTEWPVIAPEPTSIGGLYTGYVMPLAAFAAIITFLRMSIIGVGTIFGGSFRVPLVSGLTYALVSFGFGLLGLFLVGLIINGLAPTFSGEKNQRQALKVAAYAFTPAWLSSVFGLLPGLGTLLSLVAGIYGIYLLYLGLPLLMRSPKDKAGGYTAAVVICTFLLGILLMAVGAVTGFYGGASRFGGLGSSVLTPQQQQEQAAATAGNILGSMLGTDDKGKASIGAAMSNLAAAGQQIEAQQASANGGVGQSAAAAAAAATASTPTAGTTSSDATQNAAAATAGLLTALGGALGGGRHVEPVDFHTLKGMLPDSLPGMQRTNAQGSSQQALGVKNSSATAQYQGPGGAHAEIEISDVSGVAGLVDVANSVAAGTQSESDTGYEKEAIVGGRRAHEKWDNPSRHGEVTIIAAKRFSVSVTGDGVDMSTLEQYASTINFSQLESMKDAGAQAQ